MLRKQVRLLPMPPMYDDQEKEKRIFQLRHDLKCITRRSEEVDQKTFSIGAKVAGTIIAIGETILLCAAVGGDKNEP